MFVVYEIISRGLHLPVTHFRYRDEAEWFIVEDCCDDGSDAARYYVEFSQEIPDYESI
jgi:hypothetical protein